MVHKLPLPQQASSHEVEVRHIPSGTRREESQEYLTASFSTLSVALLDDPHIDTVWHHSSTGHPSLCDGGESSTPLAPIAFTPQLHSTTQPLTLEGITRINLQNRFKKSARSTLWSERPFLGFQDPKEEPSHLAIYPREKVYEKRPSNPSTTHAKPRLQRLQPHSKKDGSDDSLKMRNPMSILAKTTAEERRSLAEIKANIWAKKRKRVTFDLDERMPKPKAGRISNTYASGSYHGAHGHDGAKQPSCSKPAQHSPPVSKLVVIEWANSLKTIEYIFAKGKCDPRDAEKLRNTLFKIEEHKSRMTRQLLRETKLVDEVRKVISEEDYSLSTRALAERICSFWERAEMV
ncbi:hypothetical protein D9615_000137 [Tricholomella constricta]|uniref:Uncharacterized protein n=1 Tax=Tricholomella constricta TaxID=117010 RepID=A0A8H5MBZ5_9AGAR|nr:hypothetical protein D9615_000137 [Tricholomella constricta]